MKFNNAWIFPNGEIHYTHEQSHIIALQTFGLQENLYSKAKTIDFTESELRKHLNFDISYIAMKLGYIRITSFSDQFAVQHIGKIDEHMQNAILKAYYNLQQTYNVQFSCIAIEQFQTTSAVLFYNDLAGFKQYIKNAG